MHVSHYGIDYIKVRVKNESLFVVNSTVSDRRALDGVPLKPKISVPRNYVMMTHISKQMPSAEEGKLIHEAVKNVETATKSSFIITVFGNIFFAGGMYLIWGIVNTL